MSVNNSISDGIRNDNVNKDENTETASAKAVKEIERRKSETEAKVPVSKTAESLIKTNQSPMEKLYHTAKPMAMRGYQ